MAGDDPCLTGTENHNARTLDKRISIVGENIFDQEPVVEEEQERGQKCNKDYRVRNQVVSVVVKEYQVECTHQRQVDQDHDENPDAIL